MTKRNEPPDPDVITNDIRHSLRVLGLLHTLGQIDAHLAWAAHEKPAAGALLARVLGEEAACKLEHRIERRIRQSGLAERKTLEGFDWAFQPSLEKGLVLELARLDFVRRRDDLIITGKAGTGKSHILKAIALSACQQQMRVRYARCVDLLDDLYAGLADGSYPERLRGWASVELLVIDDVGLGQVKKRENEPTAAHTLYDLIDRRHTNVSTALTSNIHLSSWGKYLGDAHLAVAVLDRLSMRAVRININGPSFRQHVAQERAKKQRRPLPDDFVRPAKEVSGMSRDRPSFDRTPIRPDRVPRVDGSFAAISHRFLRDGFFASLEHHETLLYLVLALVADRQGMSFYRDDRLAGTLRFTLDDFLSARVGFLRKDLIAHDGTRHQVLSLPASPVLLTSHDAAAALPPPVAPSHVRHALHDFLARLDEPPRR